MKLVNPFDYPISILIGGVILVAGIRFFRFPNLVILPATAAISVASATVLKSREANPQNLANKELEQELKVISGLAKSLAEKAEILRQEANQLLGGETFHMDLLVTVQSVCNRSIELPQKITEVSRKLPNNEALLSVDDLQRQLLEVKSKQKSSYGISQQHLQQLAASLERNIQLAKAGKDTRQAKIFSLQTMVQDSAGLLQELENKLRNANLNNSEEIQDLRSLSDELNSYQDNIKMFL
ncbi:hypothetical protein [Hydrocoleum sp. CS-953]|uniref:hypothetical protein n=1 Tax=Microcoleaceae TaxID=1892252 RepID=UPI000B9C00EE|nr:hypothetical protein [Hydrocoleum sp. CS-953]OZH52006.1 hypothetical protein AFK68_27135 [Hydrocoleum sp. CS-953]